MRTMAAAVLTILLLVLSAQAGKLNPALAQVYATRGPNETQPVLIVLSDRVIVSEITDKLTERGLSLPEIHQQIMEALQEEAASTQSAVIKSIDILKTSGMAGQVRKLWITNALSADLNHAAAELVANMAEVSEVGLDDSVTLRKSLSSIPAEGQKLHVEDALRKIAARDVWLTGFRGESRIVCTISDGVDATRPMLATRWRGRAALPTECWYDGEPGGSPSACGNEGTALTGILCGADGATGDTIGVAPAATWIGAKLLCGKTRLSDLMAALQWAADPDGNAATFTEVPDVICNSWGLSSSCEGAFPENAWDVIDNVEALGPVLIFAANEEPNAGPSSVRVPEALPSCFAVGSVDATGGTPTINKESGHGPSPCDASVIKPELVAPGTAIRTLDSKGFVRISGTDAAAAMVAGTVALLRQANRNLSASEIKSILITTADDLGSPGADNVYGYGMLNASQAVTMALSSGRSGTVVGTVRYGGQPLTGARVILSGSFGDLVTTTSGGVFKFDHVVADRKYGLSVGRFGYKYYFKPDSIPVSTGQIVDVTVGLERGFFDDATHDQGWSLGVEGDNATSGVWVRAMPVGSMINGKQVQPPDDAEPHDHYCFVTGNAASASTDASEADVDGGHTTLRSPLFNLSELAEPILSFFYWYNNDLGPNPGSDFFRVQLSNDGGLHWVNVINTSASSPGWSHVKVPVKDFIKPTDHMLLQFNAEDEGPESLVEAAVDDIEITGTPTVPEPPRDLIMDVQFNQVVLTWRKSPTASGYQVYLSGDADRVVAPENLLATVTDTTLTVPMSSIRYNQFYFQVTAKK